MKTASHLAAGEAVDVHVLLERVHLAAERVAAHDDIEPADRLADRRPPVEHLRSASRIIPAHEP